MDVIIEPLKKVLTFVLWGKLGEPIADPDNPMSIHQKDTRFMVWHLLLLVLGFSLVRNFISNIIPNFRIFKHSK